MSGSSKNLGSTEGRSAFGQGQGLLFFRQHALGHHVVLLPVRLAQGVDANPLAGAWRMDEAVIAQVDGDVVDPAALDVEEDQVARLEVAFATLTPCPLAMALEVRGRSTSATSVKAYLTRPLQSKPLLGLLPPQR